MKSPRQTTPLSSWKTAKTAFQTICPNYPSYFLKDDETVIKGHAKLDLQIFTRIAKSLSVTRRYVGKEPCSQVTNIYNQIMAQELPLSGIECTIVPRKKAMNQPISASTVRRLLQKNDFQALKKLVPPTTLDYFKSPKATPVIEAIHSTEDVTHY